MMRVKDDCVIGAFSPPHPSPDHKAGRVRQGQKLQESLRPTLEGYCFGYRGFALFPPTVPIVRSFLNVAFSVTNSSFSLRIALHLCRRNQRCDRVPRFSASNLFNVSHSAGSLFSHENERVMTRSAYIGLGAKPTQKYLKSELSGIFNSCTIRLISSREVSKIYILHINILKLCTF